MMNNSVNDVVQALQMLSGKNDSSYKGPINYAPSPIHQAPSIVQQTMQETQAGEKHDGMSVLVGISYKSVSGNFKNRDFLIRKVVKTKKDVFLDGIAMDIRAPRLIKASDIQEIRDMGSARVYTNALQFVRDRLGVTVEAETEQTPQMSGIAKVIERMRHEVTVLMYVVALDGVRMRSERDTVAKYVRSQTTDLIYADQELDEYLVSLAPDPESAGVAFQHVLSKDQNALQAFVETLTNVIMADGVADDKEKMFLSKVLNLLESRGFQFNLGL